MVRDDCNGSQMITESQENCYHMIAIDHRIELTTVFLWPKLHCTYKYSFIGIHVQMYMNLKQHSRQGPEAALLKYHLEAKF